MPRKVPYVACCVICVSAGDLTKAGLNDKGTDMSILRATMLLGAALLAGSVATASAADLHRGSIKDTYVPSSHVAAGPMSWYVRLDGSYTRFDDPSLTESGRFDMFNASIDNSWGIGGGIGHYFSRTVRADVTWDHRFEADVKGTAGPAAGIVPNGTRSFGLKSDVVLANVYYDVDRGGRINPYVGLGIGFAHNTTTAGSINDPCGGGCSGSIASDSQWSVAGALMSGVTFAVRDRMHIDAGYRYLYIGDAQTGVVTGTCPGVCAPGNIELKDQWSHEFRLGLRYDIR